MNNLKVPVIEPSEIPSKPARGPLKVRRVDGFKLRNTSEEMQEFGIFATSIRYPNIVPPNEIWIDKNVPDCELPFIITQAKHEIKASDDGKDPDEAYDYGLTAGRAERGMDKGECGGFRPYHKEVIPDVYVELWKKIESDGEVVEVWIVDELKVRSMYRTDFTQGGHSFIYPFQPEPEIWIGNQVAEEERPFILLHEFTERQKMKHEELDYDDAHELASKTEYAARKRAMAEGKEKALSWLNNSTGGALVKPPVWGADITEIPRSRQNSPRNQKVENYEGLLTRTKELPAQEPKAPSAEPIKPVKLATVSNSTAKPEGAPESVVKTPPTTRKKPPSPVAPKISAPIKKKPQTINASDKPPRTEVIEHQQQTAIQPKAQKPVSISGSDIDSGSDQSSGTVNIRGPVAPKVNAPKPRENGDQKREREQKEGRIAKDEQTGYERQQRLGQGMAAEIDKEAQRRSVKPSDVEQRAREIAQNYGEPLAWNHIEEAGGQLQREAEKEQRAVPETGISVHPEQNNEQEGIGQETDPMRGFIAAIQDVKDDPEEALRLWRQAPANIRRQVYENLPFDVKEAVRLAAEAEMVRKNREAEEAWRQKEKEEALRPPLTDIPQTKALRQTAITQRKELGGGKNKSEVLEFEGGNKGVYKPKDGEQDFSYWYGISDRLYAREAASYDLAHAFGLGDLHPPTIIREVENGVGSCQSFVNNATIAGEVARVPGETDKYDLNVLYDGDKDAARVAAFDYVSGNFDRHGANFMLTDDNKVVLIDNGLSFPSSNAKGVHFGFIRHAANKKLQIPQEAKSWKWENVETVMKYHNFDENEIAAAKERFEHLQSMNDFEELKKTSPVQNLKYWESFARKVNIKG